jgi:hypothetical protein
MSLVVARQWGSMIAIVGDTHLVQSYGERAGLLQGIIKTRILADDLCVSFAGSLHWAEVALKEVDTRSVKDASRVKGVLSRIHSDSDGAVDFLVAEAAPSPLLTLIKGREAHTVTVAWLGPPWDLRGFNQFGANNLARAWVIDLFPVAIARLRCAGSGFSFRNNLHTDPWLVFACSSPCRG